MVETVIGSEYIEEPVKQFKVNFFNKFPRIMGCPNRRRIVYNSQQKADYVKKYGKTNPIYMTVYAFKNVYLEDLPRTHQSAVVDKAAFDLDEKNAYEETMRFHEILMDKNIIHTIRLSGSGLHLYEGIRENLQYPKVALWNYWDYLYGQRYCHKCGERLSLHFKKDKCPSCKEDLVEERRYTNPFHESWKYQTPMLDLCTSTRGDLGRILRCPNTFNFKSNCYCIDLDEYVLEKCKSIKELRKFAAKPYRPKEIYFGKYLHDISEFDCSNEQYTTLGENIIRYSPGSCDNLKINEDVEFDFEDLPYCIKELIKNELRFYERNELIKFLFNQTNTEIPYTISDVMGILKKISKIEPWLNWIFQRDLNLLVRNVSVIHANDTLYSFCGRLINMGHCNKEKCTWKNIISKV